MSWTVADVMTREVVVVEPDEDFKTCARLLRSNRISALPVVEPRSRRVVGVVSESDLLAKERRRGAKPPFLGLRWEDDGSGGRTAGDVMTSSAVCVSVTATIPEAARLMYREGVKRLPVIDAKGDLVGIVSRSDLLKTFLRSDESIKEDIAEDVLRNSLSIDPRTVGVEVDRGVVRLSGTIESRSLVALVERMVARVEGTVAVENKLGYRFDDARIRVEEPPGSLQLSAQERSPR
ncbi:MAG TPA: CBS domain-containing protein [Candidatus Dormibacteraeota bacterium]|nr:CBS domain-containing protein [Candidatus Dormibacteraeota bacterium]